MISMSVETTGLAGFAKRLLRDTEQDALSPAARSAELAVRRARQKLSSRGGPSRPGEPPAMEEGALHDSIGRTGPFTRPGTVEIAWGVGIGDEALRRVNEWKAKDINVFEYAKLHEEGGTGADGRRYPPRSYLRSTEAEIEAQVTREIQGAL